MKLLGINQTTGTLFREVMEALCAHLGAQAGEVVLLAGTIEEPAGYKRPYTWVKGCPLRRVSPGRRIWNWLRFGWQALRAMRRYRDRFALIVTNPPVVPWLAVLGQWLFGLRYALVIYDVYPDVLVEAGLIGEGGFVDRLLRAVNAASLRRAEYVITLGYRMRRRLEAHLGRRQDVVFHVIPNWADTRFVRPLAKADNPFAREQGLTDKFVVMYSGALGDSHDLKSIVEAAEILHDQPDVRFLLIGGGLQEDDIRRLIEHKGLTNCRLLPWRDLDEIPYSLSAADCQIVSIDIGRGGTVVPSKLYSALAAGAAILAVSPPDTELVQDIERHQCGLWIEPRDPAVLAGAVRKLRDDPALLARFKINARAAAEREYDVRVGTARYVELLRPLLG